MKTKLPIFLSLSILLTGCYFDKSENSESIISNKTSNFSKSDSLIQITKNERLPVKERLNAYYSLLEYFNMNDYKKALEYGHSGYTLAQKVNDENMEGYFLYRMSIVYFRTGVKDTALHYANKSLGFAKTTKDDKLEALAENALGKVYYAILMYDKALEHAQNSLKYYEKENHKQGIFVICNDIGIIYSKLRNKKMAKHYFQLAEKIGEEIGNQQQMAHIYINYIQVFLMENDFQTAIEYGNRATEICRKYSDSYILSFALENLALAYSKKGDFDNDLKYSQECLEIAEKLDMPSRIVSALNSLARAQFNLKQYSKSEISALRALEIDSLGTLTRDLLLTLTKNYINTNNQSKALEFLQKYDNHLYFLIEEDNQQRISLLEINYETAKKELEIERQKRIITHQNLQRSLLITGVAVCIIILLLLWYMLRLRIRRNKALTERNNALAEMNATKDKFFSIISHDLKNPAVTLRDNIKLLFKNSQYWDENTLTEYQNEILKSTDEQVELIYSLLGWAQLQTGRMTFNPDTFAISDLFSNLTSVRNMAEKKGIILNISIPDNEFVTCDRNMISTVIRNLLTNAVKFTHSGGTVSLDISPCKDVMHYVSEKYTVSICDTGVGMKEEQISNLYSLVNTKSQPGTNNEKGSGLGLSVCKEMLEKHSSSLQIESTEGKGSRFWFVI